MGAAVGLSTLSVCGAGKAGLYLETQVQLLILGGFAQSSPVAFTPPAGFLHPDTPLSSVTSGWPGGAFRKCISHLSLRGISLSGTKDLLRLVGALCIASMSLHRNLLKACTVVVL